MRLGSPFIFPTGTAAAGKVVTCLDTDGNAQWAALSPGAAIPATVSSIPLSQPDKTEIYLTAPTGLDTGTTWHMRYNSSANKWFFVGGAPWRKAQTANYSGATGSSFLIPAGMGGFIMPGSSGSNSFQGLYEIDYQANMSQSTANVSTLIGIWQRTSPGGTNRAFPEIGRVIANTAQLESKSGKLISQFTPTSNELTDLSLFFAAQSAALTTFNVQAGLLTIKPVWIAGS